MYCCRCCWVTSVVSDSVRPHRRQPTRPRHPWDSPGKNTGVGCHFLLQCMKVKCESEVAQSCLTLCDPMDCSLPGSSVHGIFQARVLEWGAIAFSNQLSYQTQKDKYSMIPPAWGTPNSQIYGVRTVVIRANRGSIGSYYFMSTVSVWDDEKLLEIKSNDGCTAKWIYRMPVKFYFKIIKMVNFRLHIFYQNTEEKEFCPLLPSLPYLISWLP